MTGPLTLSVAEAARLLGVSDDLIYRMLDRGDLPEIRLGRRRLIPRAALDRLIEEAMAGQRPGDR